ncbi:MAG: FAD-dependent oxidoreductase [Chlorobium sp.]|nr:FAD-dependent oxidoreductase [Chlorobium sp.]MCW8819968.1 FAD-dependent oxidoreductase [Ignavibacteriaceae bacterium]
MSTITFTLNGKKRSAEKDLSILEACRNNGVSVPTFCFHQSLHTLGSCWMCIVEIKGKNRFVPACSTRISEGMSVETDNAELFEIRKRNLERLLEGHCGDCDGPCEVSCPAGCDIPAFVSAIARGDDHEAIRIIKDDIPLPGILGRICPAPCEDECRRHGVDEPLSICALKRFAADRDNEASDRYIPSRREKTGKKAAIIGAGPSGLTAAYYLLSEGHEVTVFDAHAQPGGMMRYGIPLFRLPAEIIEADLAPLRAMGAEFVCNTVLGCDISLEGLKNEGFDVVYLAFGAQKAAEMNIEGEKSEGVVSGIDFLKTVASGTMRSPGPRVVVIGGGNTAIDSARTALRLGAGSVRILYRRTIEEMPANRAEIQEALHEGVTIDFLTAPVSIQRDEGGIKLIVQKMKMGAPDQSGRARPVPVEHAAYALQADQVISAIGQQVDITILENPGIATAKGTVVVDPETCRTSVPWVFAGGDCVTGPDTAINAVKQGKQAARAVHLYLKGEPVTASPTLFNATYGPRDKAPEAFYKRTQPAPRAQLRELPLHLRTGGFEEVSAGLSQKSAREEALRCMRCSCTNSHDCTLRDLSSVYGVAQEQKTVGTEDFSITRNQEIRFEREKCVDCGICVRTLEETGKDGNEILRLLVERCPTGALSR